MIRLSPKISCLNGAAGVAFRSYPKRNRKCGLCCGFFSEVDPNAEIRPLSKKQEYDVKKRESFSDFIWNTDWQSHMQAEEEARKNDMDNDYLEDRKPEGFLSLARTADLNDVHLDLSEQLKPKQKEDLKHVGNMDQDTKYHPPTTREASEWERSNKFSTPVVPLNQTPDETMRAELDLQNYNQENAELLLWNMSLTCISFAATYALYTQDIAISYVVGSSGGILYLRLLKKGLEGIGSSGGLSGVSSLAAQPRLLIPILLVMAYNRWNTLAADDYGVHLELLPMLVGFFTYKAAVIGRQSMVSFTNFVKDRKKA